MRRSINALGLAAALAGAAAASAITAPESVTSLHHAFIEETDEPRRAELLQRLAQTPPLTQAEVQWLYDLFMRFPAMSVRHAVMASLRGLNVQSQHLEPAFLAYLGQSEPEPKIFGINGAFYIRSSSALPRIRKLAKQKLQSREVGDLEILSERNEWWVRYEALSVIAQWEGERSYEILERQARRSPVVAKLMAQHLWRRSLPRFIEWASSKDATDVQRAQLAFAAPANPADLRQTRAEIARFVDDRGADLTARGAAAAKLGGVADDAEIARLARACDEGPAEARDLALTALLASPAPAASAHLQRIVREHPEARTRAETLRSLAERLPPKESRALASWAAQNDAEPANRHAAAELLKKL